LMNKLDCSAMIGGRGLLGLQHFKIKDYEYARKKYYFAWIACWKEID
jgi:hypothetical protein